MKLEDVLESDDESSSVFVLPLVKVLLSPNNTSAVSLGYPPMRTRPAGDIQLEWNNQDWRRLWLTTQPPSDSLTQVVLAPRPPQLRRPSWVCVIPLGRVGKVQRRGVPAADNTSTDPPIRDPRDPPDPAPTDPPVTRITEI